MKMRVMFALVTLAITIVIGATTATRGSQAPPQPPPPPEIPSLESSAEIVPLGERARVVITGAGGNRLHGRLEVEANGRWVPVDVVLPPSVQRIR